MAGVIDICNKALRLINVDPINSIDESNEQARCCKLFYVPARDALLREHSWNFARSYAALPTTVLTHPHWKFVYGLPAEFLYALRVFPSDSSPVVSDNYYLDGRGMMAPIADERYELACMAVSAKDHETVVLTNVEAAMMEYVAVFDDTTKYDPCFVEALCYKLASEMAMPLTGNGELATFYSRSYAASLQRAKALNADEGRHVPALSPKVSSFQNSRR